MTILCDFICIMQNGIFGCEKSCYYQNNKVDEGNGGDEAAAIAYREYYLCSTNVVLVGGIGGKVGNPQDFPPFLYGKRGNPGKNAEQIELILDQVPTL